MAEIYAGQPKVHRSGVVSVDAADPADASAAVATKGYKECRFDISLTGTNITSLEAQVLFWNERQAKWFGGGSRTFTAGGQYALVADARGAAIFLKVTGFSGGSFSLSADYSLS